MKRRVKIWSVLLMLVLVSSYAAAVQNPAAQQDGTSIQLDLSGQDVITASDAGGGLSSRDLLLISAVGIVILVIALVL
jgi:hypothetical protein